MDRETLEYEPINAADHVVASAELGQRRAESIAEFFQFLDEAQQRLASGLDSESNPVTRTIRSPAEEHYTEEGNRRVYIKFESALYDDAQAMPVLWRMFDEYSESQLRRFRQLLEIEIQGLTGDRHPKKVFDRSPLGLAALIVGSITVWLSVVKTFSVDDQHGLEEFRFFLEAPVIRWLPPLVFVGGIFVMLWYIIRVRRNSVHVARLSTIARSLDLHFSDAG